MLKQAGISGGVSSELRSAAVKMVFVKEENMSEPEPCRIKHEEPEPEPCKINQEEPEPELRIIKHEDHGGWSLFFINNDCCTLGLQ